MLLLFLLAIGCNSEVGTSDIVQEPIPPQPDYAEATPPSWLASIQPPADIACEVSTKAPALMDLIRSSRPTEMESLDFYQTLSIYSDEDQSKLVGRLMYADDCPADIEVSPLPHRRTENRQQESQRYLGDTHELSLFWRIQNLRSAYEDGLTTRSAAAQTLTDLDQFLVGAPTSFCDYVQVRTDQWLQQDCREPFDYAADGRLLEADREPTFWSTKSLLAFADELRFLDRHGLCCRARISATAFRDTITETDLHAVVVSWLVQFFLHANDQDWSLAFTSINQAFFASKRFCAELVQHLGLELHYRVACLKNSLRNTGLPVDTGSLTMKLMTLPPSERAEFFIFLGERGGPLSSEELYAFSIFMSPVFAEGLVGNERFIESVLSSVCRKDGSDWLILLAIQNLTRIYNPAINDELREQLTECWSSVSTECLDRFRRICSCTGHDQIQALSQTLARTVSFSISCSKSDDRDDLAVLYLNHCDLREMEARTMRSAVQVARKTKKGRQQLLYHRRLHTAFSNLFWDRDSSTTPDNVTEFLANLVVESNTSESKFLQTYGSEQRRTASINWLIQLHENTLVVNLTQWVDFSQTRPVAKLAAFVVSRRDTERFDVKLIKFDIRVADLSPTNKTSTNNRKVEVISSTPVANPNYANSVIERVLRDVTHDVSRIVFAVESTASNLPWTIQSVPWIEQLAEKNLSVSVCFHPCQIERSTAEPAGLDEIYFFSNENYEGFRNTNPTFPFLVPDLAEVSRERGLIREEADRFGIKIKTGRSFNPTSDFPEDSAIHFAGHATSLNLRQIMQPRSMQHPHFKTLAREMQAWCRVPFVASTLVLESSESPSRLDMPSGFMSANAIRYLPIDPPKLVVLSTCDSVEGHSLPTKAPMGLAKAFWIWGVDCIIASTDSVPDDNPSKFLPDFYSQALSGRSLPESFFSAYQASLETDSVESEQTNWNFYGY